MSADWQFWIDRGGTFTDIVARGPDGGYATRKLLSEAPEHYDDAALQGIRDILGAEADAPIPAERVEAVRMGTTVATNALLERKGERTLLVVTRGLADQLRIGYQNRPRLFDLNIRLPEILYDRVVEADERMGPHGEVVQPLDEEKLEADLARAHGEGFRAVAICLMHGYRHTVHEAAAEAIAHRVGFEQVSVSHKVSPLMKFVSRGDTTVVDAYLSPILRRHVERMAAALGGARLLFMQSNGGLVDARRFQGKDAILSGPAGGIVGAVETARSAGFERIIGFDMGGTSTDVSHYAGSYERAFETEVAGVRMRAPMLDIHTVAAGGGSILHFDGRRFRVGPDSAGADPGPACYRRGGPLTVTDCNLMLGRLLPEFFPRIFGPGRDEALDVEVVRREFASLAERIGAGRTPEAVAEGFLRIAVENMANAIKRISIERGHDVTDYALNCFGGAGGQHACAVADALGIETVLIHPFAGVLSAYGMGLADIRVLRETAVEAPLAEIGQAEAAFERLEALARTEMAAQGVPPERVEAFRRLHVRYDGTDSPLTVPFGPEAAVQAAFEDQHRQRFGFVSETKGLVIEAAALELVGRTERPGEPALAGNGGGDPAPAAQTELFADGRMGEGCGSYPCGAQARRPCGRTGGPGGGHGDDSGRARLGSPAYRERQSRAGARPAAQARGGNRHRGGPRIAGGVQQPVHVGGRADGRHACRHRLLGEHQGAAGFLLRRVRPRRRTGGQRPAYPRSSRVDVGIGAVHHPVPRRNDGAGRRFHAERAL